MTPTEFQSWFMGLCEGMGEGTTPNLHQWKEVKNRIQLMDTDKEMSAPKVSGTKVLEQGQALANAERSKDIKVEDGQSRDDSTKSFQVDGSGGLDRD